MEDIKNNNLYFSKSFTHHDINKDKRDQFSTGYCRVIPNDIKEIINDSQFFQSTQLCDVYDRDYTKYINLVFDIDIVKEEQLKGMDPTTFTKNIIETFTNIFEDDKYKPLIYGYTTIKDLGNIFEIINGDILNTTIEKPHKLLSFHIIYKNVAIKFEEFDKLKIFASINNINVDYKIYSNVHRILRLPSSFKPNIAKNKEEYNKSKNANKNICRNNEFDGYFDDEPTPKNQKKFYMLNTRGLLYNNIEGKFKKYFYSSKNLDNNAKKIYQSSVQTFNKDVKMFTCEEIIEIIKNKYSVEYRTTQERKKILIKDYKEKRNEEKEDEENLKRWDLIKFLMENLSIGRGYDNILFEVGNYVPSSNKLKKYKMSNNQFLNYYTEIYNSHEHASKQDLPSISKKGLAYCLNKILKDSCELFKSKNDSDETFIKFLEYLKINTDDENYKKENIKNRWKIIENKFKKIFTEIYLKAFENYDYSCTSTTVYKLFTKYKDSGSFYRYLMSLKCFYKYEGKIIIMFDINNFKCLKFSNTENKNYMKEILGVNRLSENYFKNHVQIIKMDEFNKINYKQIIGRKDFEITEINKFEKYLKCLYSETFADKRIGNICKNLLIYDIKNRFSKSLNFVRLYYGSGGEGKTSEYSLISNIIGNNAMNIDTSNITKQQKKEILSKQYLCIDEAKLDYANINEVLQVIKQYSCYGEYGVRGMGEEEQIRKVNTRFQINTNDIKLYRKIMSEDTDAIYRRFIFGKRIKSKNSEWLGEMSRDKIFCENLANYIYNNLEYDDKIINYNYLLEFNTKENLEVKAMKQDKINDLIGFLENDDGILFEGYINKKDYDDKILHKFTTITNIYRYYYNTMRENNDNGILKKNNYKDKIIEQGLFKELKHIYDKDGNRKTGNYLLLLVNLNEYFENDSNEDANENICPNTSNDDFDGYIDDTKPQQQTQTITPEEQPIRKVKQERKPRPIINTSTKNKESTTESSDDEDNNESEILEFEI